MANDSHSLGYHYDYCVGSLKNVLLGICPRDPRYVNFLFVLLVVIKRDFYLFPPFPLRTSVEGHLGGLVATC